MTTNITNKFNAHKTITFNCNGIEHNLNPTDALSLGEALIAECKDLNNANTNEVGEPTYIWAVLNAGDDVHSKTTLNKLCEQVGTSNCNSAIFDTMNGHPIFESGVDANSYDSLMKRINKLNPEIDELTKRIDAASRPNSFTPSRILNYIMKPRLDSARVSRERAIDELDKLRIMYGVKIDVIEGVIYK